ncbi:uncharacterized protein [Euphorbia lathyris]|uniref:uncharacterized protein isoform X2 n=1 Tax=Euphorbia lathyris TaxID=212925 RepID=UPI003313C8A9
MGDMLFNIRWHHGGNLKSNEKGIQYIGGSVEVLREYNADKLSRLDLLWILREHFKYIFWGPLYYQPKGKLNFVEIVKDGDIWDMIKGIESEGTVDVYVEAVDDRANVEGGVHNGDELSSVANMCIRPTSTTSTYSEPLKEAAPTSEAEINVEEINTEADKDNSDAGEEEYDGGSDKESKTTDDELYNVELEDDEDSNADEEVNEIKQSVSSYRKERSRRNRGVGQKEIELREAGPDIGFHDWLKEGNSYVGLLGGDEDYIGSSDDDSFASDEDGEEVESDRELTGRRRRTRVHYDPNCEEPLWELGMIFESSEQFREALANYAVKKGVQLTIRPNDSNRVRARCLANCPWHLYGSKNKRTNNFMVKTYRPVHSCYRTNTNRHCNTVYLTKFLKKKVTENPGVKIWQLQEHVKNTLEIYVGRTICRKAKLNIMKDYMGDYVKEFARLYDYRDEILRSNPGSTCVVLVDSKEIPVKLFFRGFYVCFDALKKGFTEGCRKCIGIDGNFLKGTVKNMMLVAVGKDGNHQIYPIAWAVVDSETKETYKWFLNLLQKDLGLGNGDGLCIVTDMQKFGTAEIGQVISNGSRIVKNSNVVTGDLGYHPTKEKWKGKEAMTCTELQRCRGKKEIAMRTRAEVAARAASAVARASSARAAAERFAMTSASGIARGTASGSASRQSSSQPANRHGSQPPNTSASQPPSSQAKTNPNVVRWY